MYYSLASFRENQGFFQTPNKCNAILYYVRKISSSKRNLIINIKIAFLCTEPEAKIFKSYFQNKPLKVQNL